MTVDKQHGEGSTSVASSVFHSIKSQQTRASNISRHDIVIEDFIREAHPDHYLTTTHTYRLDLSGFASEGRATMEVEKDPAVGYLADRAFSPPVMRMSTEEGHFQDMPAFARMQYKFDGVLYIIYHVIWGRSEDETSHCFILSPRQLQELDSQGDCPLNDKLIKAVTEWSHDLHDEVFVFDQGRWSKDKLLYQSVQKAGWDDVILEPTTKTSIIEDITVFFNNRALYTEFNVPWKRGIILHGPPGNGKTITIKALMQELGARKDDPIPSLYVKTLESDCGGEASIRQIFRQARLSAPCILVFEDLDSLVGDRVRSYFLNEVDGLESNDGILMIGSTNHLGKLDPAIAKRPSRFDRKYAFELPAFAQRLLYAQYWQRKFERSSRVTFPADAAHFLATITEDFSYAYMKELIVTSLMITVGDSGDQIEAGLNASLAAVKLEAENQEAAKDAAAKSAKSFAQIEVPASLRDNNFVQILRKQASVLRYEMASTAGVTEESKDKKTEGEES